MTGKPRWLKWAGRSGRAVGAFIIIAWLYRVWVLTPMPLPRTVADARLVGTIAAAVLGVVLAFPVRHGIDAGLVAVGGVLAGHTWAEQRASDITLSFWNALESTMHELQRFHLLLAALILGGWAVSRGLQSWYVRHARKV